MAEKTTQRKYHVHKDGFIVFEVPESWRDYIEKNTSSPEVSLTIEFNSETWDDFMIFVMVAPRPHDQINSNDLKQCFLFNLKQNFPALWEETISLESFQGCSGVGFIIDAIDMNIGKEMESYDNYRHLIQGVLPVDDLIVSFSILTHEDESPYRQEALKILKQARKEKILLN